MLRLVIPERELFDEATETFINLKEQPIQLEHSLISLTKWESKWRKPFLSNEKKTLEQTIDYIRCMTLTQGLNDIVFRTLPPDIVNQINEYVDSSFTATTFSHEDPPSREIVTAEIIYYMMIKLGIPFECQKWHLSRLMTLIRVCSIKESPEKKMGRQELLARNRELNEARKAKYNTKG